MSVAKLREALFVEQGRLRKRYNLLVTLRSHMEGKGVPKRVLRDLERELRRLKALISAYGWASCCIPHTPRGPE